MTNISKNYPAISANGYSPVFPCPLSVDDDVVLRDLIIETRPEVVVVCLGAPKQELWINENRDFLQKNGVLIVAGLGGTIDFLSGHIHRAPKVVRILGMEWLWRCILEPFRVPRYVKSVYTLLLFALKRAT